MSDDAPPVRPGPEWSPGWIRRRARNVYRRPLLVGGVAAACFTVIVVALVTTSGTASPTSQMLPTSPTSPASPTSATPQATASSSGVAVMWPAALIVGMVAGLGVAFGLETHDPRVADAAEAESTAECEVLVTLGTSERTQERRRKADRQVPPLVELASDGFRMLHTQLADRSFQLPLVAVLGDSPVVTAVVAANLAAAVARQVRTTILVDADFETHSLATITRVRREPGLANVISGEAEWAAAIGSVVVDRDRTMDVLPGGSFGRMPSGRGRRLDIADARLADILEHLSRRYECVVVSMPISRRGTISIPASARMPAVVCVRTGRTRVHGLAELMAAFRAHGAVARGLVVWERDDPLVAS